MKGKAGVQAVELEISRMLQDFVPDSPDNIALCPTFAPECNLASVHLPPLCTPVSPHGVCCVCSLPLWSPSSQYRQHIVFLRL